MLAFALSSSVDARDAVTPATIHDYRHTMWGQKEGAPADIWAITQTPDGWLWLGTASGLYRFDGMTFEKYDLTTIGSTASRSVSSLYTSRSGDLWVLYSAAGLDVLKVGSTFSGGASEGLPAGAPVDDMLEDGVGHMVALVGGHFYGFDRGRWHVLDDDQLGLPPSKAYGFERRGGDTWAVASDGMYVLAKGQQRFKPVASEALKDSSLFAGANGGLWRATLETGFSLVPSATLSSPRSMARYSYANASHAYLMDEQGSLWSVVCPASMICRLKHAAAHDMPFTSDAMRNDGLDAPDGMPSSIAMTLFEDRDGNIWLGTKLGLERFRKPDLVAVRFPTPLIYFAMIANPNGSLWVGTASMGVGDHWWSVAENQAVMSPHFDKATTAAYRDNDGNILLGSQAGMWRFDGTEFHDLDMPEPARDIKLQAMVRDGTGRLWASFRGLPVYAQIDGHWLLKGNLNELPDNSPARAVTDRLGQAWFGYFANQLTVVSGTKVTTLDSSNGLDLGTTTALLPDPPSLVGGERGLALLEGSRFRRLKSQHPEALTSITGLVRTEDGTLWINGSAGAVRIAAADLKRAIEEPAFEMPVKIFNTENGMPGGAQQIRPLPSLSEGADGRLWFAGTTGLAWLDPKTLLRNSAPPHLVIRSLEAGGKAYSPITPIKLPARTRDLRISYTALNLAYPERQTFRYKLEGARQRWQDAGNRREAIYTNLGAGHYRFRVQAGNEDGVWNLDGASIAFDIAPTFYETSWFVVLCAACALALIWLLFSLRLRQVKRHMRDRMDARNAERERIARDLHDTLLQGAQGLLLRLQVWAKDVSLSQQRREEIKEAMLHTRDMLDEGRDRIMSLRRETDRGEQLESLLQAAGDELSSMSPSHFLLEVHGDPAQSVWKWCSTYSTLHARHSETRSLMPMRRISALLLSTRQTHSRSPFWMMVAASGTTYCGKAAAEGIGASKACKSALIILQRICRSSVGRKAGQPYASPSRLALPTTGGNGVVGWGGAKVTNPRQTVS